MSTGPQTTRFGVLIRAATQDREMVGALGVNQARLFTLTLFADHRDHEGIGDDREVHVRVGGDARDLERAAQPREVLIAVGPLVLGLLWLLMHRTRFGVLIRAATQDRDRAHAADHRDHEGIGDDREVHVRVGGDARDLERASGSSCTAPGSAC
jgi:ABC-type uncharacterized transport system permease subunit